jgi:hypothetical protein
MNIPPPVAAQIQALLKPTDHHFSDLVDDQAFAKTMIYRASRDGLASDIGSLIRVVQELQLITVLLDNSIALGKPV